MYVYCMDVHVILEGQRFVWNSDKAVINQEKHGVSFDQAVYVFFDPFVRFIESGTEEESRSAAIGEDAVQGLLFVVHVLRDDDVIRIVSARAVNGRERREYEEHE